MNSVAATLDGNIMIPDDALAFSQLSIGLATHIPIRDRASTSIAQDNKQHEEDESEAKNDANNCEKLIRIQLPKPRNKVIPAPLFEKVDPSTQEY